MQRAEFCVAYFVGNARAVLLLLPHHGYEVVGRYDVLGARPAGRLALRDFSRISVYGLFAGYLFPAALDNEASAVFCSEVCLPAGLATQAFLPRCKAVYVVRRQVHRVMIQPCLLDA